MKRFNILYSSADIHAGIKKLFAQPSSHDRRVALVAYVGGDGESYLPHPEGLHLICSPSPGGTDPETLRRFIKRGATVEFSDGLHMKVYWSQNRGCIITSANASSHALSVGGLKEAGIWLPPGCVNIDRLIKYVHPRPAMQKELHKLDSLSRVHKKNVGFRDNHRMQVPEFLNWYDSPYRSMWKISWTDCIVEGTAKVAREQTQVEYGRKEPHTWECVGKNKVRNNEWLLSFTFTKSGIKCLRWHYVDFIVKISPKEKRYYDRAYPFHAVQVHPISKYPRPPFRISGKFRKAFRQAVKKYSRDRITEAKSYFPPVQLLKEIAAEMRRR